MGGRCMCEGGRNVCERVCEVGGVCVCACVRERVGKERV